MTPEQRIRWVYEAKDAQDLRERYDEWANEYEAHIDGALNYLAPAAAVERLSRQVATHAKILDAGAGTGFIGQHLYAAGYRSLVAVDNSPGMLAIARQKGVYQELSQQDLLGPLDFETARFDAVVAIGIFTYGHVSAAAFDELIRVTRPGGMILFSVVKKFLEGTFNDDLRRLVVAGKWTPIDEGTPFRFSGRPTGNVDPFGLLLAYEVK